MPGYMAGGPVRQPYAGVDFMFQSGIYEFGYSMHKAKLLLYATTPKDFTDFLHFRRYKTFQKQHLVCFFIYGGLKGH
jgi:hypothetical protein